MNARSGGTGIFAIAAALAAAVALGCDSDGARDAAEHLEKAAEEVEKAAEDAGRAVEEGAEDLGDEADDAVRRMDRALDRAADDVRESLDGLGKKK